MNLPWDGGTAVQHRHRRRRRTAAQEAPYNPQMVLNLVGGSLVAPSTRRRNRRGIARCESGLERRLGHALAATTGFRWRAASDPLQEVGRWSHLGLVLTAQLPWMGSRPDFAVYRISDAIHETPLLVVEADGFHFHERTAEQAERDRSRDQRATQSAPPACSCAGHRVLPRR